MIIEDKTGLKKNSLFGTEVAQTQDSVENFCAKIAAGKRAQKTKEFMIIARIESLILEQGMEDALVRAAAYVKAGADGIMIHSRRKEPDEIFAFVERFRQSDQTTPVVVVPTSFHTVTEEEFKERGGQCGDLCKPADQNRISCHAEGGGDDPQISQGEGMRRQVYVDTGDPPSDSGGRIKITAGRTERMKEMKNEKIQDIEKLLREKGAASVLLVCGNSFRSQALYGRIQEAAEKAGGGTYGILGFYPQSRI